jgi:hypothetical protein
VAAPLYLQHHPGTGSLYLSLSSNAIPIACVPARRGRAPPRRDRCVCIRRRTSTAVSHLAAASAPPFVRIAHEAPARPRRACWRVCALGAAVASEKSSFSVHTGRLSSSSSAIRRRAHSGVAAHSETAAESRGGSARGASRRRRACARSPRSASLTARRLRRLRGRRAALPR